MRKNLHQLKFGVFLSKALNIIIRKYNNDDDNGGHNCDDPVKKAMTDE